MADAFSAFFSKIILLNPQGIIALKERNLMIVAVLLMLIVVIPVFVFTFYIVWKYRAGNHRADAANQPSSKSAPKYNPDWDHNAAIEALWWGVPCIIILILSVITWKSSHELNPYQPLVSDVPPVTIQVVALDWKWLFIYPTQGIATVNFVEFPAGTPINFEVTSDAPMNSFWIPQLAGQIYAMPGMSTQLHLEAFKPGSYDGFSANISGAGFAGMKFIAQSVSQSDFDQWVASVQQASSTLTLTAYDQLAQPSENNAVAFYSAVDQTLYNETVMKYMMPDTQGDQGMAMPLSSPMIPAASTSPSWPQAASQSTSTPAMQTTTDMDMMPSMQSMPGMYMQ